MLIFILIMIILKKMKVGEEFEYDFEGKKYYFKRISPYFLEVRENGGEEKLVSIEKGVEIRIDYDFYDLPYFFKWQAPISAAAKSKLKFFLKIPLRKKLVVEAGKRDIEIASSVEREKKAWYGELYEGVLCRYVRPEVFLKPEKGDFANAPIRIVNNNDETKEIEKFLIYPDYLLLFSSEEMGNMLFTNKIYVNIIEKDEYSVEYARKTTKKAKKAKKLLDQRARSPKKVLTKFSPLKIAREFGL